jgi:hypothetical protein
MSDINCSKFFEEFITTTGQNVLLCENTLNQKKTYRINCYNSKLNKNCEHNTNKTDQFQYLEKMKIKTDQFHIFYNFYNPLEETKLTINIKKMF